MREHRPNVGLTNGRPHIQAAFDSAYYIHLPKVGPTNDNQCIQAVYDSADYIHRLNDTHTKNEKWAAHGLLTEAVGSLVDRSCPLCKLIKISAHGLHIGNSGGRSGQLTFNIVIISNHGLPLCSLDCYIT